MPRKPRPAPKPVVRCSEDGTTTIVTKTHDVEAAHDAILEWLLTDLGMEDDEALDNLTAYLGQTPRKAHGRWTLHGAQDGMQWTPADPSGRGVTRALVWVL
ncbi:hypothetical protein HUN59_04685 [Curtobacterium sp. Csp2]|uniref:hypothetical protein n=1 Tax=Curtobacterium sp. Csp2 TaxID=2495430 RepID=UPI0015806A13|nr:hypothetical protein [Curtobacterium sp. Csp2]QKS15607.1 hypothetical protein HUN59_04685 [Curtobacterium sp. Csp2]